MGTAKRERQKAGRQARIEALQAEQRKRKQRRNALAVVGFVVGLVALALILAYAFKSDKKSNVATSASTTLDLSSTTSVANATTTVGGPPKTVAFTYGSGACPNADGSSPVTKTFTAAPKQCIDPTKSYTAVFDTTEGEIDVQLDTKTVPGTVNNFVALSQYHYYDNTPIFRTDPSIAIIQAGGTSVNDPGPGYTIPDEGTGFTYQAGQLVMARGQAPNSAGAEFFVVTGPEASVLNSQGTYVVFGNITKGLDVAQKIIGLNVDDPTSQLGGHPSRTVTIKSIKITAS